MFWNCPSFFIHTLACCWDIKQTTTSFIHRGNPNTRGSFCSRKCKNWRVQCWFWFVSCRISTMWSSFWSVWKDYAISCVCVLDQLLSTLLSFVGKSWWLDIYSQILFSYLPTGILELSIHTTTLELRSQAWSLLTFNLPLSTKTEYGYLYGWIRNGNTRKNLVKNCEPKRYSWKLRTYLPNWCWTTHMPENFQLKPAFLC